MKKHRHLFTTRSIVFLLALLTSATTWAFKTETPVSYTVSRSNNNSTIYIKSGTTEITHWTASTTIGSSLYYWTAGDSHNLANGMSVMPSKDVAVDVTTATIQTETTFTFITSGTTAITGVTFKMGSGNVAASSTSSEPGTSFTVTLPAHKTFSSFEVTFGNISGSCGSSATWSLSKQNGKYTALTIGGSGAMNNYSGSNTPWDNDLTSVTVGSGITSIGNNAFNGCTALTRVDVQKTDGLVTLGSGALTGCNALAAIVAPTPALAVGYQTAMNWSAHASKLRVALGNYLFTATDEGGTAAYAITSETDLRNLSAYVNAKNDASSLIFCQTADITLIGDFTPIGVNDVSHFQGTYDGGDHTISGLSVNGSEIYAGLFSYVWNGTVKNVRLISPSVASNGTYAYVGTIVGFTTKAHVENCWVYNPTVSATGTYGVAGAIIGRSSDGSDVLTNLYFYDSNGGHSYTAVARNASSHVTRVGRARKVTLGSGVTVSPAATDMDYGFTYNNEKYYREGQELTLNYSAPSGYALVSYSANGTAFSGNTYTVNSTDGDATLGVNLAVPYLDENGVQQLCTNYTMLNDGIVQMGKPGWFVASGNLNYTGTITLHNGFYGDSHLILMDGCEMNIGTSTNRINGPGIKNGYPYTNFTIYGQSTGSDMGTLSVYSTEHAIHARSITINGGHVIANASETSAAAFVSESNVTINGGIVEATATDSSAGAIYTLGDFTYNGGNVTANADDDVFRYAIFSLKKNLTFNWRNPSDQITIGTAGIFAPTELNVTPSITFNRLFTDGNGGYYGGTFSVDDISILAGKTLTGTTELVLANDADNTARIAAASNISEPIDVTLADRTLYKDGDWNTLCLPFDVTLAGSPLEGATVMKLTTSTSNLTDGTLTLNFEDETTTMTAGTPYIIKWTKDEGYDAADPDTRDLKNPVFTGVTIDKTIDAQSFDAEDKSILLVGGNNLYWPQAGASIKACRAYFQLNGLTIGDTNNQVREFHLNFGDGDTTGIKTTNFTNYTNKAGVWFTLDGRKLNEKPTTKGIYVNRGRKIVIK